MPLITGLIQNGALNPVTGLLYINFEAPFIDITTNPDTLVGTDRWSTPITAGSVSFSLSATVSQNVSVRFWPVRTQSVDAYYLQSGVLYTGPRFQHTDNQWYTGQAPFVSGTNLLLTKQTTTVETEVIPAFSAIIPDAASLEFWQLFPRGMNPLNAGNMFQSAYLVAQTLATVPEFANALSSFKFRGNWDNATNYAKNDVVRRDGSAWVSVSNTSQVNKDPLLVANQVPTVGAVWDLYVSKGDAGGASAASVGYSSGVWTPQTTTPASRADIAGALDARDLLIANNSGQGALVRATLAANTPITGAGNTIDWDSNSGSITDTAGVFSFPAGGGDNYRVDLRLFTDVISTANSVAGHLSIRCVLIKNGSVLCDLFQWSTVETIAKKEFRMYGWWEGVLANNDTLAVRMLLVTTTTTGTITARVVGGALDNEIVIRKVKR